MQKVTKKVRQHWQAKNGAAGGKPAWQPCNALVPQIVITTIIVKIYVSPLNGSMPHKGSRPYNWSNLQRSRSARSQLLLAVIAD